LITDDGKVSEKEFHTAPWMMGEADDNDKSTDDQNDDEDNDDDESDDTHVNAVDLDNSSFYGTDDLDDDDDIESNRYSDNYS